MDYYHSLLLGGTLPLLCTVQRYGKAKRTTPCVASLYQPETINAYNDKPVEVETMQTSTLTFRHAKTLKDSWVVVAETQNRTFDEVIKIGRYRFKHITKHSRA
jgi:hypothetical protein